MLSKFKKSVAAPLVLMSAFATHAWAGITDAEGFYTSPTCDKTVVIMGAVTSRKGENPTGIKSSNDKWDLEIYKNETKKTWSLVGINKNPASKYEAACILSSGDEELPLETKPFYAKYFGGNNVAQNPGAPKL